MSARNSILLALAAFAILLYLWAREDETERAARATVETATPEPERVKRKEPPKQEPKTVAVEVILRHPDGSPVPGVRVRLVEGEELARAVTDADGIARFPEVAYALMHVWAFRRKLGTLSPRDGESRFIYTIDNTVDLVVRVSAAGKARLPDGLRITDPVLIGVVYDTAKAEVRGSFIPPADSRSFFVTARAPGFASMDKVVSLRRPRPIKVDLDLVATTKVTIDVAGPTWTLSVIELEKPRVLRRTIRGEPISPGPSEWQPAKRGKRTNLNKQQIRYDLGPGRYRLRLKNMPVVFHEFDAGRDSVHLSIDLSRAEEQEIQLRARAPINLRDAVLHLGWRRHPYSGGQMYFILPGDREVTIEPRHPLLKPVEPLRLVQGGDPITFNLEPRTLVRFNVPSGLKGRVHARLGKKTVVVGGYGEGYAFAAEPGRYELSVYVDRLELSVRTIDVPDGGIDLGVLPIR